MSRIRTELLPTTLEPLVLETLTAGTLHGHAILRRIHATNDDVPLFEEGLLYPALHRMEARGWIRSAWAAEEHGRRVKYYRLSRAGRSRVPGKPPARRHPAEAAS